MSAPSSRAFWEVSLLGPDPTPGELVEIDALAAGARTAAARSAGAAVAVAGLIRDAEDSGWVGGAADGLAVAARPVGSAADDLAEGCALLAAELGIWSDDLSGLQREAQHLHDAAVDAAARATAARAALDVAEHELGRALVVERDADQGARGRARAHVGDARWAVSHQQGVIADAAAELEDLRRRAAALAERWGSAADAASDRVSRATQHPGGRPAFASTYAIGVAAQLLPGLDLDADGDGTIAPGELASALSEVHAPGMLPSRREEMMEALAPLILGAGEDPDVAREVVAALGADGLEQIADTIAADVARELISDRFAGYGTTVGLEHLPDGLISGVRAAFENGAFGQRPDFIDIDGPSAAEVADAAARFGHAMGWIALGVMLVGATIATGGTAAVVVAASGQVAGGLVVATAVTEVVAGGIIEGDRDHAVSGAVGVILGASGAAAQSLRHLDDAGDVAANAAGMVMGATRQTVTITMEDDDDDD